MIHIRPELGEGLGELAARFDGYVPDNVKAADLTGYAAFEGDFCVGYLLFTISSGLTVTRLCFRDSETGDGLLKTAAGFAVKIEMPRIVCTDTRDPFLLEEAGFSSDETGAYRADPRKMKRQCGG